MLIALCRKLILVIITLMILSFISYHILMRDPLNHFSDEGGISAYVSYVSSLLHGDLGISYSNGESLAGQILNVFPATLLLCFSASMVSLIVGLPLGFIATAKRYTLCGKWLVLLSSLSLAVPVFWLAIVLLYFASIYQWQIASVGVLHPIYHIQPQTGFRVLDIFLAESEFKLKMMQSALHHLALPTLVLSVPATLEVIRFTHQRADYVMQQNYIKTAYTRGWSPWRIWRLLVLRNTFPPLVPMIARNVILIFAFAMLIENLFSWSGIGRWLINALSVQDYNAISAGVIAIGLFVLAVDLVANMLVFLLDPTQRKDWYDK